MSNDLYVIRPDGTMRPVANEYRAIVDALDGATLDFRVVDSVTGVYLDDEGMFKRLPLNVPASFHAASPLFGPVVLCAAQPDREGETLPPDPQVVRMMHMFCERWAAVCTQSALMGTDPHAYANPDDMPGPIILFGDEADTFLGWNFSGDEPDDPREPRGDDGLRE